MNEAYKRMLHEHFLQHTPIKYESVTDEQWKNMNSAYCLELKVAIKRCFEDLADGINRAGEALREFGKKMQK